MLKFLAIDVTLLGSLLHGSYLKSNIVIFQKYGSLSLDERKKTINSLNYTSSVYHDRSKLKFYEEKCDCTAN